MKILAYRDLRVAKNVVPFLLVIKSKFVVVCVRVYIGGPLLYENVRLVQNSVTLNGSQRVLFDDVISEDECSELNHLAHSVTAAGDGYKGKMSPHTPNEKFEGATVLKTLKASVKPRCGRMVGFSSGGENPHGVRAVTRGQRCAVALWFTLDPLYRELERLQADEVIQGLDNQHMRDQGLHINPKDEL
ncbi:hypothetical protein cypCar_00033070 [Cyprinus carpio]|nr:hypothetical protein cypCar_00033070 [Cyprinus carpio]